MKEFLEWLTEGTERLLSMCPSTVVLAAFPKPGLPWESARKGYGADGLVEWSDVYRLFSVSAGTITSELHGLCREAETGEHVVFVFTREDIAALEALQKEGLL